MSTKLLVHMFLVSTKDAIYYCSINSGPLSCAHQIHSSQPSNCGVGEISKHTYMEKPRKNKCYHQTHDQKITERLIPPPPACLRTGITAPSQCSPLVPSLHETDVLFAVDVFRIDTTNFAAPVLGGTDIMISLKFT